MENNTPTAIVTGGSRGIGRTVSLRLAQAGFQVYLTYVSRPVEAEAVCEEIRAQGGQAAAFALEIGDSAQVETFFKDQIKDKVDLAVLVNNAGMTKDGLLVRMKNEDWERVLQVNLNGAFYCLREAGKIMMKRRAGRIVNISSVVAQSGNAGQANYSASKAGLLGLTKSAALELAPRGVTVNAVTPGFIETDMTSALPEDIKKKYSERIPLGRFGTADDVASVVAFLASEAAGYVTGQVIAVNGGLYM